MKRLAQYLRRGRHRGQLAPHLNGPEAFAEWERRGQALVDAFERSIQNEIAAAHRAQIEALLPPASDVPRIGGVVIRDYDPRYVDLEPAAAVELVKPADPLTGEPPEYQLSLTVPNRPPDA